MSSTTTSPSSTWKMARQSPCRTRRRPGGSPLHGGDAGVPLCRCRRDGLQPLQHLPALPGWHGPQTLRRVAGEDQRHTAGSPLENARSSLLFPSSERAGFVCAPSCLIEPCRTPELAIIRGARPKAGAGPAYPFQASLGFPTFTAHAQAASANSCVGPALLPAGRHWRRIDL
jgi:hypothetical protein